MSMIHSRQAEQENEFNTNLDKRPGPCPRFR